MGGGGGGQTSTVSTQMDPAIAAQLNAIMGQATAAGQQAYQPYTGAPRISPMTEDQLAGQNVIRQAAGIGTDQYQGAQNAYDAVLGYRPERIDPSGFQVNPGSATVHHDATAGQAAASAGYDARTATAARDFEAGQGTASRYDATTLTDAQRAAMQNNRQDVRNVARDAVSTSNLPQTDLSGYLNPYTRQVVDNTTAEINRSYDQTAQRLAGNAALSGAFGGDRAAVEQAENNRNRANQIADTTGSLYQSGFNTAQGLAEADIARQLQAQGMNQQTGLQAQGMNQGVDQSMALANQQARVQAGLADLGYQNQAGSQNAQMGTAMSQFNAGQTTQARQANQAQANQVAMYNSGQQNTVGMNNLAQANQVNMYNAGQNTQAALANQQAWNQGDQYNTTLNLQGQLANQQVDMQSALANQNNSTAFNNQRLQAAAGLGSLGTTMAGSGYAAGNALMGIGAQQQAQNQANLTMVNQDFQNQRNWPQNQIGWQSQVLFGSPMSRQGSSTTTTPGPSTTSQIAGLGTAALGAAASYWGSAQGGTVPYRYANGGTVQYFPGGIVDDFGSDGGDSAPLDFGGGGGDAALTGFGDGASAPPPMDFSQNTAPQWNQTPTADWQTPQVGIGQATPAVPPRTNRLRDAASAFASGMSDTSKQQQPRQMAPAAPNLGPTQGYTAPVVPGSQPQQYPQYQPPAPVQQPQAGIGMRPPGFARGGQTQQPADMFTQGVKTFQLGQRLAKGAQWLGNQLGGSAAAPETGNFVLGNSTLSDMMAPANGWANSGLADGAFLKTGFAPSEIMNSMGMPSELTNALIGDPSGLVNAVVPQELGSMVAGSPDLAASAGITSGTADLGGTGTLVSALGGTGEGAATGALGSLLSGGEGALGMAGLGAAGMGAAEIGSLMGGIGGAGAAGAFSAAELLPALVLLKDGGVVPGYEEGGIAAPRTAIGRRLQRLWYGDVPTIPEPADPAVAAPRTGIGRAAQYLVFGSPDEMTGDEDMPGVALDPLAGDATLPPLRGDDPTTSYAPTMLDDPLPAPTSSVAPVSPATQSAPAAFQPETEGEDTGEGMDDRQLPNGALNADIDPLDDVNVAAGGTYDATNDPEHDYLQPLASEAQAPAEAPAATDAPAASSLGIKSSWGVPLMRAGLAMMAGQSPHALTNIGAAGVSTLDWLEQRQQRELQARLRADQLARQERRDANTDQWHRETLAQRERLGTAGNHTSVFEQKRQAYLAVHPNDAPGALAFAGGHRHMTEAEMYKAALTSANQQWAAFKDSREARGVKQEDYLANATDKIFNRFKQLNGQTAGPAPAATTQPRPNVAGQPARPQAANRPLPKEGDIVKQKGTDGVERRYVVRNGAYVLQP